MQEYKIITDTYLFNHEDGLMEQDPIRDRYDLSNLDDADYEIQVKKDELIDDYGDEVYPNPDPDLNDKINEFLWYIESLDKPHSTTYIGTDCIVHLFVSF